MKLNDFLPKAQCQTTKLAQAKIPEDLHAAVRKQMAKDVQKGIPIDWTSLFEAACRAYLAERGVKEIP